MVCNTLIKSIQGEQKCKCSLIESWPGDDDANVFEQLLMINRRCRQAGTKKRNMIKEENFQANEVKRRQY